MCVYGACWFMSVCCVAAVVENTFSSLGVL